MYYTARVTREGKHWLAEFVDAPGCQTFADSEAELRAAATEALEGWLEAHLVTGQAPPEPRAPKRRRGARSVPPPLPGQVLEVHVNARLGTVLQLRWARQRAGLSQAQLGKRAGVSQQQIANLENPDKNPTLETIEKVGRALGLDLEVQFRERADVA